MVKELEGAGGSWKAMLLVALLQLAEMLAMRAGGAAAGAWRLMWRKVKVRQGRRGGRGGSAVQQWWRQLRSYVHQQRCGIRQMSVEAGLEEVQGGAAGGVVQVAATPLARARGGTNGLGGSRTSGWSWRQKVLLVLLVGMVVPVEAAAAAQAVGGAAAAVAAAAAAASTVVNYWALLEDDTVGDLQVLCKEAGTIRIMSTNLRRVKRDATGQDMSKVVWEQTMRAVDDAAALGHMGSTGYGGGGWWSTWAGSPMECWEAEGCSWVRLGWHEDGVDSSAGSQRQEGDQEGRILSGGAGEVEG